ncbi:MAG TPA: AMP-binding protein, partial [Chitinispirillaceae bacterium]|nr:AMP-binding protein [Chitinispirillaceae bacterium]
HHRQIQQKQFVKGNTFVSKTTLNRKNDGREEIITVFRAVLSNPLTTCDDLYSVLEDQLKIAEDLLGDKNDYGRGVINRKIIIKKEEKPTDDEILTIPIGKPIHNTKIYIVDSIGNIAPIGIQGEICIAGDAVAHGYFNNEELNKKCFITNPFHKGNYHRLYRTGDLGMYLPDGSIKFLGRIDDQIKIRGRRIECGEVESILCSNAEIADAAVVGRKSEKGMELIAFYVSKHNEVVSLESLREFLKCKIPEYMIPALFIEQKRLPIMPNGKIDKKKLQQIAITQSA